MAKKARAKKRKEAPTPPSELSKLISESAYKTLVRNIKTAESDKNESVGRMGSLVNQAVEKHNLNKMIFGWMRRLDRLNGAKLADAVLQLDHMLDISGISERAAQQNEMFEGSETGAIPAEPEPLKGSFAEKVKQSKTDLAATENAAENGTEAEPSPRSRKPRSPSPAEIKAIADRAETTH